MTSALDAAYLITGTDAPKIRLAVERLRNRFDAGSVEVLHAAEATGADAVAACNALGLFGTDARLVVIEDVDAWRAGDVAPITEYLKNATPDTVLALVGHATKKDSALAKAVAKRGKVLVYDAPRKRQLPAWVAKQFEQLGVRADADACRMLVEVVGEDADILRNEIEKLATWAAEDEVTARDVGALASGPSETQGYDVTDAWSRRDVAGVLAATEALLERSAARELPRLVGTFAHHVARVRAAHALAAEGVRPRDAAGRLKVHPFVAEKAFAAAAKFTPDELAHATVQLAALDHALKGGSRVRPELEVERALVEITRPREQASR